MNTPILIMLAGGLCINSVASAAAPPQQADLSALTATKGTASPSVRTLLANPQPLAPVRASLLQPRAAKNRVVDTFTGEALVQDTAGAFMLDNASTSTFLFDGLSEAGGTSLITPTTTMFMSDARTDLATTTLVQVEMGAYDTAGSPTIWVDSTATGLLLDTWRFDLGTTLGGTDLITLEAPFAVISSGMVAFASNGTIIGEFPLALDASTTTALGGLGTVGLGGGNIAGFDLFSIQLWWEVKFNQTQPQSCLADLNGDGFVDIGDINAFITSFVAGCP